MGCGASKGSDPELPRPWEKARDQDTEAATSSSKVSTGATRGRLPISEGGRERDVIVLFGPPGAGKGSQAPHIVSKLGIPALSVGGIMRCAIEEGTALGLVCREVMENDGLVPDDVVAGLIRDRIARKDCDRGFVMDGFPRTVEQAQMFDDVLAYTHERVTRIVVLEAPEDVLERRVAGRWIHKSSGRAYHAVTAPPSSLPPCDSPTTLNMLDDATGEPLTRRLDDVEATLRRRLRGYEEQFSGVTSHYAATRVVTAVDANQDPTHVRSCVEAAIEGRAQPATVPFEMPGTRVGVAEGGADTAVVDGPAAVDTHAAVDGGVGFDGVDAADGDPQVAFQPLPDSPTHSAIPGVGEMSAQPEPIAV
jgi:adenylate kinase